ncbi:gamma carbonic anhydrase family protein [Myxococcota bacterium]
MANGLDRWLDRASPFDVLMALVRPFLEHVPRIAADAFVAENAVLIGDVEIGSAASVWYGCVLRGDCGLVRVGARSNVQDLSLLHVTRGRAITRIGEEVTIGHRVIVHSARVGDGALIGSGAVLLDDVEIGEEALVAAGSLVPPGMKIPSRSLVRGQPARIVRELGLDECGRGREGAQRYLELGGIYLGTRTPLRL